ncbi:methyltransferase [uncultured Caulobacter sp.]|uniref:methyltransferase n=1 Tax=uncultured Caulobacter sp. TaxID=158749 RepID=UPI00261063AD|nr:methyltransferase [uncultured Caulobacter sp.]
MPGQRADAALGAVLQHLDSAGYDFTTPNPATVRRWLSRPPPARPDLRDILGWGFPFRRGDLPEALFEALREAGALVESDRGQRARIRAARVDGRLFLHSACAGAGPDAVFVGPDSYRFAALIGREIGAAPVRRALDVGTGAGVGAVVTGARVPGARIFASDVNAAALRLASANAAHAGVSATFRLSPGLDDAPSDLDLIVANPPYVAGDSGRAYKDGGGELGEGLALDWARTALARLAPGGRMILYTGAPIRAGGRDVVRDGLEALVSAVGASLAYSELDPDIFASELGRAPYADVERIAAIGAVIRKPE